MEARRESRRPRGAGGVAPFTVEGQSAVRSAATACRASCVVRRAAASMAAQTQQGQVGWRCSLPAGGCGNVSIGDDVAVEGLLDQLAGMLDSKAFRKALAKALDAAPEVAAAAEAIVKLRDRLTTLEDALATGDLELDSFRRLAPKVRAELAAAEDVLSRSTGQSSAAALPPTGDALHRVVGQPRTGRGPRTDRSTGREGDGGAQDDRRAATSTGTRHGCRPVARYKSVTMSMMQRRATARNGTQRHESAHAKTHRFLLTLMRMSVHGTQEPITA